jgi:hypothetical protein
MESPRQVLRLVALLTLTLNSVHSFTLLQQRRLSRREAPHGVTSPRFAATSLPESSSSIKDTVMDLLGSVPRNAPTTRELTGNILRAVRLLERQCPTPDLEVLEKLSGKRNLLVRTSNTIPLVLLMCEFYVLSSLLPLYRRTLGAFVDSTGPRRTRIEEKSVPFVD